MRRLALALVVFALTGSALLAQSGACVPSVVQGQTCTVTNQVRVVCGSGEVCRCTGQLQPRWTCSGGTGGAGLVTAPGNQGEIILHKSGLLGSDSALRWDEVGDTLFCSDTTVGPGLLTTPEVAAARINGVRFAHEYATVGTGTGGDPWTNWTGAVAADTTTHLSCGSFRLTSTLTLSAGSILEGEGPCSKIVFVQTGPANAGIVNGANAGNVSVRNLYIDHDGDTAASTTSAIDITPGTGQNYLIENVHVVDSGEDGIRIDNGTSGTDTNVKVIGCTVDGADRHGIEIGIHVSHAEVVGNFVRNVNQVPSNHGVGIFASGNQSTSEWTRYVTITGNTVDGAENGIRAQGSDTTISGNVVRNCLVDGIRIRGPRMSVNGNTVTASTEQGIKAEDSTDFSIAGNTVQGNTQDGIQVRYNLSAPSKVAVSGNTVSENGFDGIRVYGGASEVNITGNQLYSNRNGIVVEAAPIGGVSKQIDRVSIIGNQVYATDANGSDVKVFVSGSPAGTLGEGIVISENILNGASVAAGGVNIPAASGAARIVVTDNTSMNHLTSDLSIPGGGVVYLRQSAQSSFLVSGGVAPPTVAAANGSEFYNEAGGLQTTHYVRENTAWRNVMSGNSIGDGTDADIPFTFNQGTGTDPTVRWNDALACFEVTPATAAWKVASGGTGITTYEVGDILYSGGTNSLSKLAGNVTTTKNLLSQTGTGSASLAPVWAALVAGDIPNLSTSKLTSGTLPTVRGGTGTGFWTSNALVTSGDAATFSSIAPGANATYLRSNGTTWSASANIDVGSAGSVDFTTASAARPHKQGTAASRPGTCTSFETYYETDTGSFKVCTAASTWNGPTLVIWPGDVVQTKLNLLSAGTETAWNVVLVMPGVYTGEFFLKKSYTALIGLDPQTTVFLKNAVVSDGDPGTFNVYDPAAPTALISHVLIRGLRFVNQLSGASGAGGDAPEPALSIGQANTGGADEGQWDDVIVENCIIEGNHDGLQVFGNTGQPNRTLIVRNNIIRSVHDAWTVKANGQIFSHHNTIQVDSTGSEPYLDGLTYQAWKSTGIHVSMNFFEGGPVSGSYIESVSDAIDVLADGNIGASSQDLVAGFLVYSIGGSDLDTVKIRVIEPSIRVRYNIDYSPTNEVAGVMIRHRIANQDGDVVVSGGSVLMEQQSTGASAPASVASVTINNSAATATAYLQIWGTQLQASNAKSGGSAYALRTVGSSPDAQITARGITTVQGMSDGSNASITVASETAATSYTQSFTSQTSVVLAHPFASYHLTAHCFNATNVEVEADTETVGSGPTYSVTVAFAAAQTGRCVVDVVGAARSSNPVRGDETFSSQTSISIPGAATSLSTELGVACYDTSSPPVRVEPNTVTVTPSTGDMTVAFFAAQSGRCITQ